METTKKLNKVSVKGLKDVLETYIEADIPLFIHGTFGEGKSDIVRQVGEKLGYVVVDFRASQGLPEDVGGIVFHGNTIDPNTGEEIVTSVRGVPDLIQRVWSVGGKTKKPVLLFLDEFNSATPTMMAAMYSIVLDRMAQGFELPKDTRIVLAGNLESDMSIVNHVPKAAENRMGHVYYTGPTIDEYMEYMSQRGIHVSIMSFLKTNPGFLNGMYADDSMVDKTEPEIPTPRTWEFLSRLYKQAEKDGKLNDPVHRMRITSSVVGGKAALAMESIFEILSGLRPYEEIIANPKSVKMPPENNIKAQYVQLLSVAANFVNREKVEEWNAVKTFLDRFNPDLKITGITYIVNNLNPDIMDEIWEDMAGVLQISEDMDLFNRKRK